MNLPKHLFISSSDGALYDTRKHNWSKQPALRENYSYTHQRIKTVSDLKATIRKGEYAWPGGYPMYLITSDGACISFYALKDVHTLRQVYNAIKTGQNDGYKIEYCNINYEDNNLYCEVTETKIESAYND